MPLRASIPSLYRPRFLLYRIRQAAIPPVQAAIPSLQDQYSLREVAIPSSQDQAGRGQSLLPREKLGQCDGGRDVAEEGHEMCDLDGVAWGSRHTGYAMPRFGSTLQSVAPRNVE